MSETVIKIVVIGDIGVGKTSLIRKYTLDDFTPDYRISTEAQFEIKDLYVGERPVHLHVWDIPGNEIFGNKTEIFYKYSHGAIVLFDLSRPETLKGAEAWYQDYMKKMELGAECLHPILLVGNKADLLPTSKPSETNYEAYSREHNMIGYFEVSARENSNILAAFRVLTEHILQNDANFL